MSDYQRAFEGTYDADALQPEDIIRNAAHKAAEELAHYMASEAPSVKWGKLIPSLSVLVEDGRRRYFDGYHIGDPAVLAGIEPGKWRYLDGYSAWLAKVMPEQTVFRPPSDPPPGEAGRGMERVDAEWPTIRDALFMHPRLTDKAREVYQEKRRQRYIEKQKEKGKEPKEGPVGRKGLYQTKYGTLNAGLGEYRARPIGSVPFYSIWPLVEEWWQREHGGAFRPNFDQAASSTALRAGGDGGSSPNKVKVWAKLIDTEALNEAAHFWAAFAGKLDLLLDLDEVVPDEDFWSRIAREIGFVGEEGGPLSRVEIKAMERSRIFRIAELTARAAKRGWIMASK